MLTALIRRGLLISQNNCRPALYRLRTADPVDTRTARERVRDWVEAQGSHRFTTRQCASGCQANERTIQRSIREWADLGVLRKDDTWGYYLIKPLPKRGGISDNGVSLQAVWHAVVTPQEESPCSTPAP